MANDLRTYLHASSKAFVGLHFPARQRQGIVQPWQANRKV